MFNHIIKASNGKKIVMFLDYDGTLSPIVQDPDRAFMSEEVSINYHYHHLILITERISSTTINTHLFYYFGLTQMRAAVKAVARYFPTAIVSGRGKEKVHYITYNIIFFSIFSSLHYYLRMNFLVRKFK